MMEYDEIGPCNFLFLHYFSMIDQITLEVQFTNPDWEDKVEHGIGLSYPGPSGCGPVDDNRMSSQRYWNSIRILESFDILIFIDKSPNCS
jgi:hypothetical protein